MTDPGENTHRGLRVQMLLKTWMIIQACIGKHDISGANEGLNLNFCVVLRRADRVTKE